MAGTARGARRGGTFDRSIGSARASSEGSPPVLRASRAVELLSVRHAAERRWPSATTSRSDLLRALRMNASQQIHVLGSDAPVAPACGARRA
jgi:hypothetical protein